jgi:hypothetical protein
MPRKYTYRKGQEVPFEAGSLMDNERKVLKKLRE